MRELSTAAVAERSPLLNAKEAAAFLTISLRSLQARAEFPRVNVSPLGSQRAMWRYRRADLEDYIDKHTIIPFRQEAFT
jgi:hypothetical protein